MPRLTSGQAGTTAEHGRQPTAQEWADATLGRGRAAWTGTTGWVRRLRDRSLVQALVLLAILVWGLAIRFNSYAATEAQFDIGLKHHAISAMEMAMTLLEEGKPFIVRPNRRRAIEDLWNEHGILGPGPWLAEYADDPPEFHSTQAPYLWPIDPGFSLFLAGWWKLIGVKSMAGARYLYAVFDVLVMVVLYFAGRRRVGPWLAFIPVLLFADCDVMYEYAAAFVVEQLALVYALIPAIYVVAGPREAERGGVRAADVLRGLVLGAWCGLIQLWRTALGPFGVVLALAYGLTHGWKRAAACTAAYLCVFTLIWGSYKATARAHTPPQNLISHPLWYSVFNGLGEFDNPWGLKASEVNGRGWYRTLNPGAELLARPLEDWSRGMVMAAVRAHPEYVVLTFCRRAIRILTMGSSIRFPHIPGLQSASRATPLVLGLVYVGLWGALRRRDRPVLAVGLVGAYALVLPFAVTTVSPVYYASALPVHYFLAACGLRDLLRLAHTGLHRFGQGLGAVLRRLGARPRNWIVAVLRWGAGVGMTCRRALTWPVLDERNARRVRGLTLLLLCGTAALSMLCVSNLLAVGAPLGGQAGYATAVSVGQPPYGSPKLAVLGPGIAALVRAAMHVFPHGTTGELAVGLLGWVALLGCASALAWRRGRWPAALFASAVLLAVPGNLAAGLAEPGTVWSVALWLGATAALLANQGIGACALAVACATGALLCRPLAAPLCLLPCAAIASANWRKGVAFALVLGGVVVALHAVAETMPGARWDAYADAFAPLLAPKLNAEPVLKSAAQLAPMLVPLIVVVCAIPGSRDRRLTCVVATAALLAIGMNPVVATATRFALLACVGAWVAYRWTPVAARVSLTWVVAAVLVIAQGGLWLQRGLPSLTPPDAAGLDTLRRHIAATAGPIFFEELLSVAPRERARPSWHAPTARATQDWFVDAPLDVEIALWRHEYALILHTGEQVRYYPHLRRVLLANYKPVASASIPCGDKPRLVTLLVPRDVPTPIESRSLARTLALLATGANPI